MRVPANTEVGFPAGCRARRIRRVRPVRARLPFASLATLVVLVLAAACSPAPVPSARPSAMTASNTATPTMTITQPPIDAALASLLPATIQGKKATTFTSSIDNVGKGDLTVICSVFCPESGLYATELGANPHLATYGFAWVDGSSVAMAAIRIPNAPADRLVRAWANARFRAAFKGTAPAATPQPGGTATPEPTPPNTVPPVITVAGKRLSVVGEGLPRYDVVYPHGDVLFVISVQQRGKATPPATPAAAATNADFRALVDTLP